MERSEPGELPPLRFAGFVSVIVLADAFTKMLAVDRLSPAYVPHPIVGDWLRMTLVYNPGAAFGLHLGPWSRWIFTALTIIAVIVMWRMYRSSPMDARWRVRALCLVTGGAFGNLVDRLRSGRGVVDFIDVGIAGWRWPTFNVADMAVSVGAVLLATVLWREDVAAAASARRISSDQPSTG